MVLGDLECSNDSLLSFGDSAALDALRANPLGHTSPAFYDMNRLQIGQLPHSGSVVGVGYAVTGTGTFSTYFTNSSHDFNSSVLNGGSFCDPPV
jgi:hypothetical protein